MVNIQIENESVIDQMLDPIYYKRFDIIIPAFNEEKRIFPVLKEITDFISVYTLPWQVIVAVDGNDGTADIVQKFSDKYKFVKLNRSSGRSGKGGAIKRSLNSATGKYIILLDADGAIDFLSVVEAVRYLSQYDVVNFDRYAYRTNYIPWSRRFVSRGFNFYVKFVLSINIDDTQCGYKLMNVESAKRIFSQLTITNGFFYAPFFYYLKLYKYKVIEMPVRYNHSEGSKFNISSMILGGFLTTLAFRISHSNLQKFFPKRLKDLYYKKFRWI